MLPELLSGERSGGLLGVRRNNKSKNLNAESTEEHREPRSIPIIMKLLIDNLDGLGAQDYTAFVDSGKAPGLVRKLNSPAELKFGLIAGHGSLAVPVLGGRVTLTLSNGNDLFTGYIVETPTYQYLGWAERGPVYRYAIDALSDVMLMDQKAPPPHPPFVDRSAGSAFEQLTAEALPGWFDVSGVEAGDPIPYYSVDPAKKWTASAAEVALLARCSYRDDNGKLLFAPLGVNTYALAENAADVFSGRSAIAEREPAGQ